MSKKITYSTFSDKEIAIMKGKICPYCDSIPELADTAEIYNGVSFGRMYICRKCGAYVSCHFGTDTPKGRLANAELRQLRIEAHEVFDAIYKLKYKRGRYQAYYWLSKELQRPFDYTHIGMMDEETCRKVIRICKEYLFRKDPDRFPQFAEI